MIRIKWNIEITHTAGKNAGRKVSYTTKYMEKLHRITEEALQNGDKVTVTPITPEDTIENTVLKAIRA